MSAYEVPLISLAGDPLDLRALAPRGALVVNVASECGLTPQYAALQSLHERYREQGFSVVGAPCNQFGGQEPGTHEEIAAFCEANYGVTFPLTGKLEVNGPERHPLYRLLCAQPDADGEAGDVQWNFEKFLVAPDGEPVARFRPTVAPDDDQIVGAVEQLLADRES